ncbi:MAG: AmmeMemoRadiSam system protein A [Candidatus Anoxymicrobium japonicum]|uniref:AmmeMemoRadiSam system protein A n=1 Tax=Candidatus Anoxymicrobium japonicum TaxID=2013648 RepID=A0A2N3G8H5_9ACTN|nr:MAG: AmmeMemoRadiSam system protein A [Candidatus Anoxymicrobium japonicum]
MTAPGEPQSEHAKLARKVVEACVRGEDLTDVENVALELKEKRAGVFVCIEKNGELRGCIGTIQPAARDIAEEIRNNAISSAKSDFRFGPVRPNELDRLTYSVDVLGEAEDIADMSHLDPKVYGVIVRSGNKSGLLLPDLEGVDTAEEQVRIAMMKAGISPGEPVALQRFTVTRHK